MILMHPDDMADRGLAADDLVEVTTGTGSFASLLVRSRSPAAARRCTRRTSSSPYARRVEDACLQERGHGCPGRIPRR